MSQRFKAVIVLKNTRDSAIRNLYILHIQLAIFPLF